MSRVVAAPRPRTTLLYDGECPFCRWTAGMLVIWDRKLIELVPERLQRRAVERLRQRESPQRAAA